MENTINQKDNHRIKRMICLLGILLPTFIFKGSNMNGLVSFVGFLFIFGLHYFTPKPPLEKFAEKEQDGLVRGFLSISLLSLGGAMGNLGFLLLDPPIASVLLGGLTVFNQVLFTMILLCTMMVLSIETVRLDDLVN